jgi:hypothetical protein
MPEAESINPQFTSEVQKRQVDVEYFILSLLLMTGTMALTRQLMWEMSLMMFRDNKLQTTNYTTSATALLLFLCTRTIGYG